MDKFKTVVFSWIIISILVIYIDKHYYNPEYVMVSKCHKAEIKMLGDRAFCIDCKLFCEIERKK